MNGESHNDWPSIRLKYLATINDEALPETTDPGLEINYIDIGNVSATTGIEATTQLLFADAPSRARRIVQDGDVIISTVRTYLQAIAPIENPAENLIVSTGFAVIRPIPEKLAPAFCKYSLRESSFLAEVEKRSVGVSYPAINSSDLGAIFIKVPTASSQYEVSAYLDRETAHIDDLIQAKENMLALLAEKRQALITQAVTRGLDPTACLKPSGVEWLGDVPEHWEVKKLKYVADLRSGEFITADSIGEEGPYPVYGGNGLRGYTLNKTHSGNYVLIGRQGALCGNINYASGDFWASEHAVVCTMLSHDNVVWLGELLRIMNLNQYSVSAAQPGLSVEVVKNLSLPVPSVREQTIIAKHITNVLTRLNSLQSAAERTITLLKERRSALITAAVTGQIDIPVANQTDALAGQVWEQKGYTDADMDRLLTTHVRTPYKKR